MEIDKDVIEELLNSKTEIQFIQIAYREKITKSIWERYNDINDHFIELKKLRNGVSVYDNIGYLRKKDK